MKEEKKDRYIEDVIASMKLNHLKELKKIFNIELKTIKKNEFINAISKYMKENSSFITENIFIYEELLLIKELCNNNYEIELSKDFNVNERSIKSLEFLGIIYLYCDSNIKKIKIPLDLREHIKNEVQNMDIINKAKERQEIVDTFNNLLKVYGIIPLYIAEKYIVKYMAEYYKIHETLKMLWQYNLRFKLYYEDDNSTYYNLEIIDRESLYEKLNTMSDINYKEYKKIDLEKIEKNDLNKIEKEIYIILKRYYKNTNFVLEELNNIKLMIQNDFSSKEISIFIGKKIKKQSELGRKRLENLIDTLRKKYPLWILKGYSIEELKKEYL